MKRTTDRRRCAENKRLGDLTNDRVTTATGIRSCGTTAARLIWTRKRKKRAKEQVIRKETGGGGSLRGDGRGKGVRTPLSY